MCVYCEYCYCSRVLLALLEKWRRGQEIIVQVDGCVVYSFSFVKSVMACFWVFIIGYLYTRESRCYG